MAQGAIRVGVAPSILFNVRLLSMFKAGDYCRAVASAPGFGPCKRVFNDACA